MGVAFSAKHLAHMTGHDLSVQYMLSPTRTTEDVRL